MTQSTVGNGFRWFTFLLLWPGIAACGRPLESGVYAFSTEAVERRTCEDAPPPPLRFVAEVEVFGNELQIATFAPRPLFATGERTLMGRFFHGRDEEREFIADSSFHTPIRVGETICPAFAQIRLDAFTEGERAFAGGLRVTYEMDLDAPRSCPRACAWAADFRAEKIGDIMNDLSRSKP